MGLWLQSHKFPQAGAGALVCEVLSWALRRTRLSPEVAVGSEGLTAAGLLVGGAVFLLPL